jgi:hypothetical protein
MLLGVDNPGANKPPDTYYAQGTDRLKTRFSTAAIPTTSFK